MYQESFYVYGVKEDIYDFHARFGNINIPFMELEILDCSRIFVDINTNKVTWTKLALIIRDW